MAEATLAIQAHYGTSDIVDRIFRALEAGGHDVARPTVQMLNLVDQLHGGGLNATRIQAELAGVAAGEKVLDAGCGVGGSSRYLSHVYECRVEAIDLTPEYVEAATRLNELCGFADRITVRQGSVTNLPYSSQTFDLVWCQNVSMNVADKRRMFAEAYRVLRPGGRYTFSHAAQGPAGAPYYPLPWALESSYSFLGTPETILEWVKEAGFEILDSRNEAGSPGTSQDRSAAELGASIIMGVDMPNRQANAARSGKEKRLIGMLVVARRPA